MTEAYDPNHRNEIVYGPVLATFIIAVFYLGILDMIINLAEPTGKDVDDVNPEALLVETDHGLITYLCTPMSSIPCTPKLSISKIPKTGGHFAKGFEVESNQPIKVQCEDDTNV